MYHTLDVFRYLLEFDALRKSLVEQQTTGKASRLCTKKRVVINDEIYEDRLRFYRNHSSVFKSRSIKYNTLYKRNKYTVLPRVMISKVSVESRERQNNVSSSKKK